MKVPEIATLETKRLRLRPLRVEDYEAYAAMHSDPEVVRFFSVGSEPWGRTRSWNHLAALLGHWLFRGTGMWAVEHRGTGDFMGVVGLAEPDGWPGCELCGRLARRFWRQGFATEAAQAALEHTFQVVRRERVISLVHPDNQASRRLVERLGERLADRIAHNGREMLCYTIDRGDFLAGRS